MSATVEVSIWLALKARITSLPFSPAYPVIYPKENKELPTSTCIQVHHLPNVNERLFVGSDAPLMRRGFLQLSVMSPLVGQVAEVDMQVAGEIAAHFKPDTAMTYGGVTVKVYRASVRPAFKDDDVSRWHTPVSIDYRVFA